MSVESMTRERSSTTAFRRPRARNIFTEIGFFLMNSATDIGSVHRSMPCPSSYAFKFLHFGAEERDDVLFLNGHERRFDFRRAYYLLFHLQRAQRVADLARDCDDIPGP